MNFGDNVSSVKGWLNQQKSNMGEAVTRFKNKEFMNAVVAGCALVSAADGDINAAEKQKMVGYIQRTDELKVFDIPEVIAQFNKFADGFEFDALIGKAEALKAVAPLRKNIEAARLLIRVCCAIGMADGEFDQSEKNVIIEMCRELQLDPAEFNLGNTAAPAVASTPNPVTPAVAPPIAPAPSPVAAPVAAAPSPVAAPIAPAPSPVAPPVAAAPSSVAPTYQPQAHDKDFLEACIAVTLLVAYANEQFAESERQTFIDFARSHALLSAYTAHDFDKMLTQAQSNFMFNTTIGKSSALQSIKKQQGKGDAVTALNQLAQAIAAADGQVDAQEQAALNDIQQNLMA